MRRERYLLLVALSVGLLLLAWWLLPGLVLKQPTPFPDRETGSQVQYDEIEVLAAVRDQVAVERLVASGVEVQAGAPLLVLVTGADSAAKAAVERAGTFGELGAALDQLPGSANGDVRALRRELQRELREQSRRMAPTATPAVSTAERELLQAERMGLEDATTALLVEITRAGPERAPALRRELAERQARLREVQERLAAPTRRVRASERIVTERPIPQSLRRLREAVLASWPRSRDTLYAPASGVFRHGNALRGDRLFVPRVGAAHGARSSSRNVTRYALAVAGYPRLLATAERVDSAATALGSRAIEVVVE